MADPLTAIGTAAAVLDLGKLVWKLGTALVKLYQDTKCIDRTVKELADEVKALGDECDLVYSELEVVISTPSGGEPSPYDVDGRLWGCLHAKVEECKITVDSLGSIVQSVSIRSADFIAQTQRQLKLNHSRDDMARLRERIKSHTDGLRMVLLMVNIKIAHIAPGLASRELSLKLSKC